MRLRAYLYRQSPPKRKSPRKWRAGNEKTARGRFHFLWAHVSHSFNLQGIANPSKGHICIVRRARRSLASCISTSRTILDVAITKQTVRDETMNQTRILRVPEVISRTGLSRSTIYLRIQEGTFPAQVKLGARSVGWSSVDVDRWIETMLSKAGA